ncbi:hypothetical protein OS493_011734 [Desmophyllum pertusum]|uniref:Myoferlin-like n=1 Tax=Desmophyllum pertusum TaxID=174260 RepID=A0A9W9YDZ2_9CNID|nr:hypothetical protein OS493_011734 [Desmophyllum pertusum]
MLSRYRATCGCSKSYCKSGINQWRDGRKPRTILNDWCVMHNKSLPVYVDEPCAVTVDGQTYTLAEFEEGAVIDKHYGKDRSRLALHVLNKMNLVPEHVETRGLYNKTQQPTMEQIYGREGNFNWRFVFPFSYIPAEKKLVIKEKEHFWSLDEAVEKLTPRLMVQIWDNDLGFANDDFLGSLQLDLISLVKPATNTSSCKLPSDTNSAPTVDLFKQKRCYGWWSMGSMKSGTFKSTGKIEMTLEAMPKAEADAKPAGQGRDDPNKNPTLEEPNRPPTSFPWFTSPFKALRHIIWGRYKWHIIGFLIFLIIFSLIAFFIYAAPGYTMKKMLNT